jgi:hypothetical protein
MPASRPFIAEDELSPEQRQDAIAEILALGALRAMGMGNEGRAGVIQAQKPVQGPFRVVQGGLTSGDVRASM